MNTFGYLYVARSTGWIPDLVKIGSTIDPVKRLSSSQTFNLIPVEFEKKYCFILPGFDKKETRNILYSIEHKIHDYLEEYHQNRGGGTEFFIGDRKVIYDKIDQALLSISGDFSLINRYAPGNDSLFETVLNTELPMVGELGFVDDDLEKYVGGGEVVEPFIKIRQCYPGTKIEIRDYQTRALASMIEPKGKLILPPGTGKTSIMCLASLNVNRCLIMVPSILLVDQMKDDCDELWKASGYTVYYISREESNIIDLDNLPLKCIIVSTYQSSEQFINTRFDMVLCDEAHHLTVENNDGYYRKIFVAGNYDRIYFFTATEKNKKFTDGNKEYEWSMDHESFGRTLFNYTVEEAIRDGYLNDYNVVFHIYQGEDEKKMTALSNIMNGGHIGRRILIKVNRIDRIDPIVNLLRLEHPKWYVDSMDGETSKKERKSIMGHIREHNNKSVLVICEVGSEGWNERSLDTVILFDLTESEIKLIQVSGRVWRIDKGKGRSNIIILCDKDTYVGKGKKIKRIYSSLLKGHPVMVKRIIKTIAEVKKMGEGKKCVLPIINECEGDIDYEEIYNSSMELIVEKLDVNAKFKMLMEYIDKNQKLPEVHLKLIGRLCVDIKQSFKRKLKGESVKNYKNFLVGWEVEVMRRPLLWNNILALVNKPLEEDMSPFDKVRELVTFVNINKKIPNRDEEGLEGKLGTFWKCLKTALLNYENGEKCYYNGDIEELWLLVSEELFLVDNLSKTRNERKMTTLGQLQPLVNFIRLYSRMPIQGTTRIKTSELEEELKLGMFWKNLRRSINNHYTKNGKYNSYKNIEELAKELIKIPFLREKLDIEIVLLIDPSIRTATVL